MLAKYESRDTEGYREKSRVKSRERVEGAML